MPTSSCLYGNRPQKFVTLLHQLGPKFKNNHMVTELAPFIFINLLRIIEKDYKT